MIRILFLAANPTDQFRLQLRREFDALRQALDAAPQGRRFHLIQEFAVAADGLQELLVRHQPQIVHFSGHGVEEGLLFEAADGRSQRVAPATLRDLFAGFRKTVRCVVLNACYSQQHADAIATVIDSVVGMSDALTDDAALAFATAFYRALANSATLAAAMALGRNQIDLQDLDEAHQPQLLAERIDAGQVHALDWDDTPPATVPLTIPRGIFGLYPFNEHFFGRDEELATLHSLLQTALSVSICPVITGMGGLGKTQLAVHYARAHVADYPDGIFWVTAADLNSIRTQLADFCVALGLQVADPQRDGDLNEQKISAFKRYLDQDPNALLIFDNVEEPDHLYTRQIGVQMTALTLGGKLIITTRRRKLSRDRFVELPLQHLLPLPARHILTNARAELAHDSDLDRLCEQFGYLPLMLNLAAAALKKRGGAIAGYLQRLQTLGAEKLHREVAKVSLDDYHKSLTAILGEQWAMLEEENARLLFRVAGQLPEAEVIPNARLGLLAGLQDIDEWECPLSDALEELQNASLVERVDAQTTRLHPLVRDFATSLTAAPERNDFRTACAQRVDTAYADLERLGHEYAKRGISALLMDLIIAIDLAQTANAMPQSPISNLQSLLRHLRLESSHLQGNAAKRQPQHLWQQLLPRSPLAGNGESTPRLTGLLRQTLHWLPHWGHQRQSIALEQTLVGHESLVLAVAVVDSQRIVSTSSDRTLKIWNLQTGTVEQTLIGHEKHVNAIAVVDSWHIVSASSDHTLKVWNLQTGAVEQTLTGHESWVLGVAVLDDQRIVSASDDHTLKVWNLTTGIVKQKLIGHKAPVRSVAVVNSQRIVSASFDRTLKVWNLQTGAVEQTFTGHEYWVRGVAVVDNQRIVSASSDRTLKVWNLQTGAVEQTFTGHEYWVLGVAVVDNQRIVSASSDRTLKVWNLTTSVVEQTLTGHEKKVNAVAVVDSQRIVSVSDDRTLKLWNLTTSQLIASIGLDGALQCVAVTRQGDRTLVVAGDAAGALYCLELVEPVASGQ